ncbi:protein translocase subunit SecF [Actinospongicola halichondriae]|uniref:protein translocase subunit SecF n=1 Tax=Actinospongicola halichondriae TaxID=3236844 RepID=UPI003D457799
MMRRLASYDNDIDFPRIWRIGYAITAVLLIASVGALVGRGLNLGIDFEGGTSWEVVAPDVSVSEARTALGGAGESGAKIQIVGGDTIRVQSEPTDDAALDAVTAALAEVAGVDVIDVSVSTVGPTWGDEISAKAQRALVFFFVVIAAYIAIRLEWKMAIGALVAVVHDLVITVGIYALFQFEVTPATVIAILTILGYSLYDTIVVYDKVKDNADTPAVAQKMPYTDLMSLSLNQVLMRSLNTTITSLLPVLAMLIVGSFILGAVTLQEFAVALTIGLVSGAYSSIFVATPLVAFLKEREPHYQSLRSRLENQESRRSGADPVPATASKSSGGSVSAPELSGRAIPPRPRKKGKRR